jgi:hypothetical protein
MIPKTIVIKPGSAQRVDPMAGPVQVCQKTGRCNDPVKPGRPMTQARPDVFFFQKIWFFSYTLFFHIFLVGY